MEVVPSMHQASHLGFEPGCPCSSQLHYIASQESIKMPQRSSLPYKGCPPPQPHSIRRDSSYPLMSPCWSERTSVSSQDRLIIPQS